MSETEDKQTGTKGNKETGEGIRKNLLTENMVRLTPHPYGQHCHIPVNIETALRVVGWGELWRSIVSANQNCFHDPIVKGDSETQTVGCRKYSPDACGNNALFGKCAFTRKDGMCLLPPRSWKKQYARLRLSALSVGNRV